MARYNGHPMFSYLMSHGAGVGYQHVNVVKAVGNGHVFYYITGMENVLDWRRDHTDRKEGRKKEKEKE